MISHIYDSKVKNPDNKLIMKLTSLSKEQLNLELFISAKIISNLKNKNKNKKCRNYLSEEDEEEELKEKCNNNFLKKIMKFCNL